MKTLNEFFRRGFESRLTRGSISQCKQTIIDNPLIIPSKLRVSMCQFAIESVFPFLEFIEWRVSNYSKLERIIMNFNGSKVLYHINTQSIREVLSIPKSNEDLIE